MSAASPNEKKVVLVIGAGDATGGAIARRFAREGYVACVTRRSADKLQPLVDAIRAEGGEAYGFASDARKYFKIWEMACFSGFLTGQAVARRMVARQRGTLLFTGATAGLRGAAGFAAFAGAKHGIRALAQSMARELGPMGLHVAHVVVDGAIDTEFIRDNFPEKYAQKAQDGILDPEHIADNYWYLHSQPRDAWTFELDLRPWMERW